MSELKGVVISTLDLPLFHYSPDVYSPSHNHGTVSDVFTPAYVCKNVIRHHGEHGGGGYGSASSVAVAHVSMQSMVTSTQGVFLFCILNTGRKLLA